MVEVFSTNVSKKKEADRLVMQLSRFMPDYQINFDLDDCDRILRIENNKTKIDIELVVELLKQNNYSCIVFND